MKGIGELLNKLKNVKSLSKGEFTAQCPAHDDKKNSLCLKQEGDKILIDCKAGCEPDSIMTSLGLQMSDLFIKPDEPIKSEPIAKIVATYDYKDESGNLLYQVVRYDPKNFKQRHRNGNNDWSWNVEGVRKVLYHLDELVKVTNDTVYLVEGEKDADNLWGVGKVATTSAGGANNWKPEYANSLAGKRVCVIPDKDSAGYNYAKNVIRSLEGKATDIKVIILPGEGIKDVSDWLLMDNDPDQLTALEQDISILLDPDRPTYQIKEDSIIWRKPIENLFLIFSADKLSEEKTGVHSKISIKYDYMSLGWSYLNIERSEDRTRLANSAYGQLKGDITKAYSKEDLRRDLDSFCAGLWDYRVSTFVAELMEGDEREQPLKFLLYPYVLDNGATIIFAPPGRGKSYTALLWAIAIDAGISKFWNVIKTTVLFINLERSKSSLQRRVATVNKVLGLPGNRPLLTMNARGHSLFDVIPNCRKAIKQYGVKFIVLDSISRAGYGDLNENQPVNRIVDAMSALCPSWMALAHTSRANEEHAYGSIMLDAGADIVVQLSSQINQETGTLGIGWEITKQNDVGRKPQSIFALEFNEFGLTALRRAKEYEFPEIEGKRHQDMLGVVMEFIRNRESADATSSEIADNTGFNRSNISTLLNRSGKFVQTRKVGVNHYYGIKTDKNSGLL